MLSKIPKLQHVVGASLLVAGALGGALATATSASAAPVSPSEFTCGVTSFTPCNQTAHFSDPSGGNGPVVGSPSPQATGCPAWLTADASIITGTGNGIEHSIINNNGDAWFTTTFTGTIQILPFLVDQLGNLVGPDPNAPTYLGHLTQWFGGSFNYHNFVNHDTMNFTGTGSDGSTLSLHVVDHMSISASALPAPTSFSITSC